MTMNEHLLERFGRVRRAVRPRNDEADIWIQPPQLNAKIRQYFEDSGRPVQGGSWLARPEIPSSSEVLDTDTNSSTSSDIVEIVPNKKVGAWGSKEEYLGALYELLREDAVQPLRLAVSRVRMTPAGTEETFNSAIGIYEKVHICGVTFSNRGLAVRVTFSLRRVGKQIRWEQSKRLISGGLVVLTPSNDMFQTKAIVATVAARPLDMLQQNPPEIDLYIARADEQEIDPAAEWIMVEDRTGFYEADRHTLLALQKMMKEPFPLSEHLVNVRPVVSAPQYVLNNPRHDLTAVLRNNKHETYENVDILKRWPTQPTSDLDASQLAALHRILTKELAIVQGPPGCGKTHVSKEALKIMLANAKPDDPPIIIACQTNHAVDQLLGKVFEFEDQFVRLGGRSKDQGAIKERTLYAIKQSTSELPLAGCLKPNARKKMRDLEKELTLMLEPLKPEKTPLDFRMLQKLGLLSAKQSDSLEAGASEWVQTAKSDVKEARASPFTVWLSEGLVSVPVKQQAEEFGFDFEEQEMGFEQLKELEAENMAKDDDDFETLYGTYLPLADNFTCRKAVGITEDKVQGVLKQQDLWKIPEAMRGEIYRFLQREMKQKILIGVREKVNFFNEQTKKRQIGQWEEDETVLRQRKVIGMTTTGFSKYRALIAALQPKIVLIEEAAETLEAPVTVACLPSVQHLVLIGDHKQLRPHCHVKGHENEPYYLNLSLFERMIKNGVEYDMLMKQRRMIPEVRRILYPIYGNKIKDHDSVLNPENRRNVPGMGGINSFFVSHQWQEQRDDQMSAFNPNEAEMIAGFVEYLLYNGVPAKDITVLTFYNGQRKKIIRLMKESAILMKVDGVPKIVTVDGYQGEENRIVILSLVRSNDRGQVGFLDVDNRVCVALSRAQEGFYMFGNGKLLYDRPIPEKHHTWMRIIDTIAGNASRPRKQELPPVEPFNRLGVELPVRCSNHNHLTLISEPSDWQKISGGCEQKCGGKLACGHPCNLKCHPFSHDMLECTHCKPVTEMTNTPRAQHASGRKPSPSFDGQETHSRTSSSSSSWKTYAQDESQRYTIAVSAPLSRRHSPEKLVLKEEKLLDVEATDDEETPKLSKLSLGMDGTVSLPGSSHSASEKGSDESAVRDGPRKKWSETHKSGGEEVAGGKGKGKGKEKVDWTQQKSLLDEDAPF